MLDSGTLLVAKFNAGATSGDFTGAGKWVELNIATPTIQSYSAYTFSSQADVLINAGQLYFPKPENTDSNAFA